MSLGSGNEKTPAHKRNSLPTAATSLDDGVVLSWPGGYPRLLCLGCPLSLRCVQGHQSAHYSARQLGMHEQAEGWHPKLQIEREREREVAFLCRSQQRKAECTVAIRWPVGDLWEVVVLLSVYLLVDWGVSLPRLRNDSGRRSGICVISFTVICPSETRRGIYASEKGQQTPTGSNRKALFALKNNSMLLMTLRAEIAFSVPFVISGPFFFPSSHIKLDLVWCLQSASSAVRLRALVAISTGGPDESDAIRKHRGCHRSINRLEQSTDIQLASVWPLLSRGKDGRHPSQSQPFSA